MKIYNAFALVAILLIGCTTTKITETEYEKDSENIKLVKTTETNANPIVVFAQNSKDKSWVLHQGGWRFNIGYADWGLSGGVLNNTFASFTNSEFGVKTALACPEILANGKYNININKDGVKSEN